MSRNNHYHYAEKFADKSRRSGIRELKRVPVKSAIFALLLLFAFGLVSTTFSAFVSVAGDDIIRGKVEYTNGVMFNLLNKKLNDDTLAGTGADKDLAATGANVNIYLQPKDSWITSGYTYKANIKWVSSNDWSSYDMSFAGLMMNGRPIYYASVNSANIYNLQLQAYDGSTWKDQYEVYAGGGTAISNYSGTNKIWYGASSSGSPDGFTLQHNGNSYGSFTLDTSTVPHKYTYTATLTKGTAYKFDVYNSSYPTGSKRFQCTGSTMTSSGTKQMFAYGTASNSNTISITPTITASFTFEWTLNDDRNTTEGYKWAVNSGNLKVTFPTTRTITVNQYKGSSGSTALLGSVSVNNTTISANGGTALVLDNTASNVSITAPDGYAFVSGSPSASAGTLTRTSGQTSTNTWTGTIKTTANSTITVRYNEVTKTVTIDTNKPGTVATSTTTTTPSSGYASSKTATVGKITGVYVYAKPNTGFEFDQWSYTSGTISVTGNTALSSGIQRCLLKGNGDTTAATLQAQFKLKQPTVTSAGYGSYGFTGVAVTSSPTATSATGTAPSSWSYAYTLTDKPSGSTATIEPSTGSFIPDKPGSYTISVTATDSQTVSGTTFTRQSNAVTATVTVYQSPSLTATVTATDDSTFEGTGASPGDPYVFVINQPLKISTALSNFDRTNLTYQWSKDNETTWEEDPKDVNDDYTNVFEFDNHDTTTNLNSKYINTSQSSTNQSFTVKCKAYLTSDPTVYTIVPVTLYYSVSSEILRVDDLYFMEDKEGNGNLAKYSTPHQKIYPENSAGLAMDITYGGSSFRSTVKYNNNRTSSYTDIFTQSSAEATANPITRFFNFATNPTTLEARLKAIFDNYTSKPGVKRFTVTVTDNQNLNANAGPIDTVVGSREVSASKSLYFYTASSLTSVRNVVLFYYLNDEWQFQNGQYISAGYYRFNVPEEVDTVYFATAKKDRYGLPTFNGSTITIDSADFSAWTKSGSSLSSVDLVNGKPKYTATISGTTISGSFGAL